ncbi:unnamed protein product [marine sediment metagenome]|uniref:Uncharacterized protein n=1 Tax=marine sediment metagenome TaxID=412755 RepID=X1T496_9ZZZZ
MPRIDKMFAFIAENNGNDEGVIGAVTPQGWMPLVGADMARVESLRPIAQRVARVTGKPVKLVVFNTRRELEVINA